MLEYEAPLHNPMLKQLDFLVGEWETTISNASFLPDPTATVHGQTLFDWAEDGAFLAMHQEGRALWLIGRDDAREDYEVFYFDSRGVSRIYHMNFDGAVWKMWREAHGFWQRFECTLGKDRNTMTAYWEKSTDDGSTWEHDFDLNYKRTR